jgi:hypothetical protein
MILIDLKNVLSFTNRSQVMGSVAQIKILFQNGKNLVILEMKKKLKNTKSWITTF